MRNPFRRSKTVDLGDFPGATLSRLGYTRADGGVVDGVRCLGVWTHPQGVDVAAYADGWVIALGEGFDHDGFDQRTWNALAEVRPEAASMLAPAPPGAKCTAELEDR